MSFFYPNNLCLLIMLFSQLTFNIGIAMSELVLIVVLVSVQLLWRNPMTMTTHIKESTSLRGLAYSFRGLVLYQDAGEGADSSTSGSAGSRKSKTLDLEWAFSNLKANSQWHTSSNKTTPPNPSNSVTPYEPIGPFSFKPQEYLVFNLSFVCFSPLLFLSSFWVDYYLVLLY